MRRKHARITLGATAVAAMLALTACADPGNGAGAESTTIEFGLPTTMGANNAPLAVAVGHGYFEDEGLNVNVTSTGGSAPTLQAVISGQLDIGSATPEPVLQFAESGGEFGGVTMVYNYVRKPTGSIAVLADSGIESLQDLAGATIGNSSLGSGNLLLADAILDSVGLEPESDYQHIAVGTGAAALQALQSGQVQALSLWDTEYAAMEAQGAELRTFTSEEAADLFSTTYFASPQLLETDPAAVEAFGRAMARATYFTQLNPEAALKVMYETYPETRTAGVPEEEQVAADLVALEARLELLVADDPQGTHSWGAYDPAAVASWTTFALATDVVTTELAPETLYTNDFVDAYNDFDAAAVEADAEEMR